MVPGLRDTDDSCFTDPVNSHCAKYPLILSCLERDALFFPDTRQPTKILIRAYYPYDLLHGLPKPTTLMLRRLPRRLRAYELANAINSIQMLNDQFDLLYVPEDAGRGLNRGYAFANFVNPKDADLFADLINRGEVTILRGCEAVFAHQQGREATLSRILENRNRPEKRNY